MTDEELIIKLWNMGLGRIAVATNYMKEHNKNAKSKKEVKRITKEQALKYVEPILFEYETKRLKGEE